MAGWFDAVRRASEIPLPRVTRLRSIDDWRAFLASPANREAEMRVYEEGLLGAEVFYVRGFCVVCEREVDFRVDHDNCWTGEDGRRVPNWRERLECPFCLLNSRMRASVGFMLAATGRRNRIYLTEAVTPLFRAMVGRRKGTVGSEYLRDGTPPGRTNAAGVRHEDVTALTFMNGSLSAIGSFDVLEHVPDFEGALREFSRCLRRGGQLFLTVPFSAGSAATATRAVVTPAGEIKHRLPPVYHGDPLDPVGALCFHEHGWDLMDAIRRAGFRTAEVMLFWNADLGYLGGHQMIITARNAAAPWW